MENTDTHWIPLKWSCEYLHCTIWPFCHFRIGGVLDQLVNMHSVTLQRESILWSPLRPSVRLSVVTSFHLFSFRSIPKEFSSDFHYTF